MQLINQAYAPKLEREEGKKKKKVVSASVILRPIEIIVYLFCIVPLPELPPSEVHEARDIALEGKSLARPHSA